MASAVKYDCLTRDLCNKVHDFYGADTGTGTDMDEIYVALTNTAPNVAIHERLADISELGAGNGYNAGGENMQATSAATGGTVTIVGQDITWTASGSLGPFRYSVAYNNTSTNDSLMFYWDYTSSITLSAAETFVWDTGASVLTVT